MRALDIRAQLSGEVARSDWIPARVRSLFDMGRLDEPSEATVSWSLGGEMLRIHLPLRLYRTWWLHPFLNEQSASIIRSLGLPVPAGDIRLNLEQGRALRPLHLVLNACAVENVLDSMIKHAVERGFHGLALHDRGLALRVLGIPPASAPQNVTELVDEVQAAYYSLHARIDAEIDLPYVEEFGVADALRVSVTQGSAEHLALFFNRLMSHRNDGPGKFRFPDMVME